MADLLQTAFGRVQVLADKRTNLTTFVGNNVKSISYSDIQNKPDSCKIALANLSLEQVEEEVLQEEQPLLVSWGVVGKFQIDKYVIIKEIEYDYGIRVNATVTCRDKKVKLMDRKAGRVWTKLTSSEIIQDIARRMGLKYLGFPTKGIVKVVQGGQSYGKIVADLAYLEGYYWQVTQDDTLLFLPAYEFDSTRNTLRWFANDPNILNLKLKTTSRRIAPKTAGSKEGKGTTATSTDTATGTPTAETQNASETPSSGDGKDHSAITFEGDGGFSSKEVKGEVDVHPANEDAVIAKKRARASVLRAKWKTAEVSATLENMRVETGDVVDLSGVANLHTGKYKVHAADTVYDGAKIKIKAKLKKDTGKRKKGKKPTDTATPDKGAASGKDKAADDVANVTVVKFKDDGSFSEVK